MHFATWVEKESGFWGAQKGQHGLAWRVGLHTHITGLKTYLFLPSGYYYDLDDSYDESDEEEVRAHLRCVAEQPPLKLDTSSEVSGVSSPLCQAVGLGFWCPRQWPAFGFPSVPADPSFAGTPLHSSRPPDPRCPGMRSGFSSSKAWHRVGCGAWVGGLRGPQEGPRGQWNHTTAGGFKLVCFLSQSRS